MTMKSWDICRTQQSKSPLNFLKINSCFPDKSQCLMDQELLSSNCSEDPQRDWCAKMTDLELFLLKTFEDGWEQHKSQRAQSRRLLSGSWRGGSGNQPLEGSHLSVFSLWMSFQEPMEKAIWPWPSGIVHSNLDACLSPSYSRGWGWRMALAKSLRVAWGIYWDNTLTNKNKYKLPKSLHTLLEPSRRLWAMASEERQTKEGRLMRWCL